MGIKGYVLQFSITENYANFSRIYAEIGPGTRVALSKLAVEKLEQENRPLRIAVDM